MTDPEIRVREFLADLAALGYSDAQAAAAIGCTPATAFRIRQRQVAPSPVIANALRYHKRLVDAGLEPSVPLAPRGAAAHRTRRA